MKTLLNILLTKIHVYFMHKLAWFTAHLASCSVQISKMAARKRKGSWEGARYKHSHVLLLALGTGHFSSVRTAQPVGLIIYMYFLFFSQTYIIPFSSGDSSFIFLAVEVCVDKSYFTGFVFYGDKSFFLGLKYFFSEYIPFFFNNRPTDPNF